MSENADSDVPHPRYTGALFGHDEAEQALLGSYRGGRIPHAWLIGGPSGIGKATLAYRLARFVLAHPDPVAPEVQTATSLAVAADAPAARQIAGEAHPDLLVLRRTINEKTGKLYQDIVADEVRRVVPFFGSTAGEGGWRIVIVDAVEELNPAGANALLKLLEEPPPRSLLLLISHVPGRVLPTIRSRCRVLLLRPLDEASVAKAVAAALGRAPDEPDIVEAAAAADGNVGRALALLDGPMLALRKKVMAALDQLPNTDPRTLHSLGDAIAGSEAQPLLTFVDLVNEWLSARLERGTAPIQRLGRIGRIWGEVNEAARQAELYNLDRRPLVFSVFGLLAEAARG
jgi:DNA polymerase-3 subunit delta'